MEMIRGKYRATIGERWHGQIKVIFLFFCVWVVCLTTCFVVGTEAASVSHVPPVSAVQGMDVLVTAGLSDQEAPVQAKLFFRQMGQEEYISLPMAIKRGSECEGRIPARYVVGTGIEYYVVFYLADNTRVTSPEQDPVFLPHVIVILPAEQEWYQVLYPETNSIIENRKPQISAAFDPVANIAPDDIRVKLDGWDVTGTCEITQDFFLYVPSEDLSPGDHIVTMENLSNPEMLGSWQFTVSGKPALWQNISGGASVTWQWADADSDSAFLIYSPGSNFGFTSQVAGQAFGRSIDAWVNRSASYTPGSTDFGLGIHGSKARIGAGDLFPSISRMTLDGMPVRGGEIEIKPSDRLGFYLVKGEVRFLLDDKDEFAAGLLNSKFEGFQVSAWPLRGKWEVSAFYIHARNYAASEPDIPFSIEKENNILSLRTDLHLPAGFTFNGELAGSDHLTRYGEEFASDSSKDTGFSLSLKKLVKSLILEMFYLNIGDEFTSEVNPFLESGRNGFGFSGRYFHKKGLSIGGEYGRYYRDSETSNEARLNANLSLSKLPSLFASYYQQRVAYAKYDIKGISLGSSYRIWRLGFSVSGSYSDTDLWTDLTERRSISALGSLEYKITENTELRLGFSRSASHQSEDTSRMQEQASIGFRQRVGKHHLFSIDLKSASLTDEKSAENDYFEKIMALRYGYSL